jgi:hypothetical protein
VGSNLAWGLALGAAVAAVVIVLVILFTGGSSGSPVSPARAGHGPPASVSAFEAELRLELRYGGHGDDETASVRCPHRIEPRQLVRCELRYTDGIARAMLVRLTPTGELEADIPYPATLRR